MLQLVVEVVLIQGARNCSREYPQRQLGDRSSPSYKEATKSSDAPRIQLISITQVRSRRAGLTRCVVSRLDLNHPPTAVGGILKGAKLFFVHPPRSPVSLCLSSLGTINTTEPQGSTEVIQRKASHPPAIPTRPDMTAIQSDVEWSAREVRDRTKGIAHSIEAH